ncbi:MAG: hypothetical protein P8Z00_13215 [Anaerolineales bacterium]|jgi:hypothetical protein
MKRKVVNETDRMKMVHLERYLDRNLQPVAPRAEFVIALRDKLNHVELQAEEDLLEREPRALHLALLGGAGVLSSILMVITGVRAVLALIGAIGTLKQMRQQLAKPPATASTTSP